MLLCGGGLGVIRGGGDWGMRERDGFGCFGRVRWVDCFEKVPWAPPLPSVVCLKWVRLWFRIRR